MRISPRLVLCLFTVGVSLTACAPKKEDQPAQPPMPVSETVFAPTLSTLDKARSVEGTLQQDRDAADAAIKAAE